jgi:hypothetical protein
MGRLVKSFLAVAAIAGASLAATLTADAQRIGAQRWAADAETLVEQASTYSCSGCPWQIRPLRGGGCHSTLCKPNRDCSGGSRYNGRRCECPSGSSWNGDHNGYCQRRPDPPNRPAQQQYRPPQPQYRPAQPQCPGGAFWNGSQCMCPGASVWNGSQCQCPGGSFWNGNQCMCRPGTSWNGSQCAA